MIRNLNANLKEQLGESESYHDVFDKFVFEITENGTDRLDNVSTCNLND